ncbi:MAG: uracil-DNA glycosylase [Acidobacteria bacterium]|nr:uracil-DNA glycosylase [Acidobacteriota bacterium]
MGIDSIRLNLPASQHPQASRLAGKEGRGEGALGVKAGSASENVFSPPVLARAAGRAAHMREIRDDLGDCVRCKLHRHRTQIVFGAGAEHAELMFVGEAPGADEDAQGIPFVGRAGQLLTRIIESIGLKRDQVYIANIIKCRPPQNRNPEPDEIEKCSPFLLRQIALIQPRIICALGKFAAQTLLETTAPISQLRGRVFDKFGARVVPTFHPSYLLRNPAGKREVWEDMKTIRRMLDERP